MRRLPFLALLPLLFVQTAVLSAGDYWAGSSESGITTNNDCGSISTVSGSPVIRRAFMTDGDQGVAAFAADRINAGDEVLTPEGARLELVSGNNVIVVLGSGARVKFLGLRAFAVDGAASVTRLDMHLLAGSLRMQVRLNERSPEAALVRMNDADVLLVRGDVEGSAEGEWRASVLAGSAELRQRRAGAPGAPVTVREGTKTGTGNAGENPLGADEIEAIRRRLPFSFEIMGAALPPRPAMGALQEAP